MDIFLRTYSILNQNGRIIGLVGLHTDITERKRAEEALKESEERFRNLSNASLEGIMIHDHGVILDVNMAFVLLFGYEQPEDLIGKNGPDLLLNPESQARIRQRMQQQEIGPIDVIGIRKNGTTFYGETESQKIKYLGQDVRIVSCRDITERKQAEEELKISREQLIKADKMIALGTLVAGVAHEINNPNNFVMLNAPLIQEVWKGISPVLEEYYRENGDFKAGGMSYSKMREGVPILLNGIMEGTRRISSIVKELKDFAKPDDTYMNQQVDINAVVKGAVNLLQNVISKATDLFSVTYGEKLSEVIGNFQRLEQVVINIVHNACQALPDKTKGIAVITSCDDQSIIVRVTDEGQGIPQEYLNQIMDPFFTKKQGSGGMGLGLSISQKIVIDHGGHIDVESTEGKGSTFTIFLPRA